MIELISINKDKIYKNRLHISIVCNIEHLALVKSLCLLCKDTCNSCLDFIVKDYLSEHKQLILTFTTLRIAERTAESISYLTGIPCKWHESFGRITKPVIEPSKCSV